MESITTQGITNAVWMAACAFGGRAFLPTAYALFEVGDSALSRTLVTAITALAATSIHIAGSAYFDPCNRCNADFRLTTSSICVGALIGLASNRAYRAYQQAQQQRVLT